MDKCFLREDGSFPEMLNYQGQAFELLDICGDLLRDKTTGDAVQKKDTSSGKYWDKKGRQVNSRGYLVDRIGNIIDKNGHKVFDKKEIDSNGEIPKLFKFTRFDENEVYGNIKFNDQGEIIRPDNEGSKSGKGIQDNDGKKINQKGFLLDAKGNVIDRKGSICF